MLNVLRSLGPTRLAIVGGVTVAMLAFLAFIALRMSQPPMGLLFGNLDLQDSGQIVAKLETMKVPYEIRAGGQQVLVPEEQVLRLRMAMAQGGLPSGGSIGYEIFDRTDSLGTTNFVQSINHLRALEGEIARTIRALDQVSNARVHLVLPKREVFSREQREPSASIVLKLRGAGRLERGQVAAIQNLVAAAVPDLKPARVSIVDDKGNLLARGANDGDGATAQAMTFAEMRTTIENRLRQGIESLLERSLGPGSVRAEVTADIDYDRIVTNQELFDPDGQVVRSTQSITENNNSTEQDATQVTVANNLPEAQARQDGNRSSVTGARSEETVNYEISKTIRTQTREGGVVKRLSVAVLVDGNYATKEGQKEYAPRSEQELQQIATLVRSAVGFDARRGDTVEVVNMRFAGAEEIGNAAESDAFLGLEKSDLFRIGEKLLLGLLALIALLFVVRPIVNRLLVGPAQPGMLTAPGVAGQAQLPPGTATPALMSPEQAGAMTAAGPRSAIEQMIDVAKVQGQVKASSIKKIGEIVSNHPEEAVSIMRNWIYQNA
ncbi:MAG: flagellar M-ring protein FliF [Alphaproteobacteria bacterium]|nr:flagellar M-ring protein FliF [Alphaproteobacteria bacterium]